MATLHVRDFPDDVYTKLRALAEIENRSLSQEAIVLLKRAVELEGSNRERRRRIVRALKENRPLRAAPEPEELIREDRNRS
ncbi:MAG: FitA-like ribbon-helix-helix domain-containing protein [Spirochaetaceae bacterium]